MPQELDHLTLPESESRVDEHDQVFYVRLEGATSRPAGSPNRQTVSLARFLLGTSPRPAASGVPAQSYERWLLALMVLGVILRLTRYLLRFPLWEDEAMLSANFIDRGYAGLLQPLHYCQVAPILFLWGQLTLTKLLGFNEYTLRLVPFLCGLGSLFLFRHVAGRLLQGAALVLAVGLFAVAYPMTRYAAEAKPYGCDLLVALAMIALTIEWLRQPQQARWLWYLAALACPAVGYSFPTIFIGGGVSLVVAWVLWTGRGQRTFLVPRDEARGHNAPNANRHLAERDGYVKARGWLPWVVFNLVLLAGVVVATSISRNSVDAATHQNMEEGWANAFPPIAQPLRLPLWLLEIHAGAMLGYPVGGPNWGSSFSLLCCAIGVGAFAARRQWLLLALLLAPLGLNFAAAAAHRFPYGGHARMTLFLAPAFCILIATGLAAAIAWIDARRSTRFSRALASIVGWTSFRKKPDGPGRPSYKAEPGRPSRSMTIALGLLVLLGTGSWLRDLSQPYKSGTTLRARQFAQWFWFQLPQGGELVSCETDMQLDPMPGKVNCGWSSLYFCNQRIYSPRHARGAKPDWARVSTDWPLRCVLYRSPKEERESPPPDPRAREQWLEKMQATYALAGHDKYPFVAYDKSDRRPISDDYLEVFTFVPRSGPGLTDSCRWQE